MLSQSAEYALRAVLYLARNGAGERLRSDQISAALGVPRNYTGKVLHTLTRSGVLASVRGPGGGFTLARPADHLSLFDVVEPFGGLLEKRTCLLGQDECSDQAPCTAHAHWKSVGDRVAFFFRETTVGAMVAGAPLPTGDFAIAAPHPARSNGQTTARDKAAPSPASALIPNPEEGT